MALNFDLTNTKAFREKMPTSRFSMLRVVVFETIAVGMGEITATNVREFYARSCFWRRLTDANPLPFDLVYACIGLATNVAHETWAQFVKRHVRYTRNDLLRHAQDTQNDFSDSAIDDRCDVCGHYFMHRRDCASLDPAFEAHRPGPDCVHCDNYVCLTHNVCHACGMEPGS